MHIKVVVDNACIQDNVTVYTQTDGSYRTGEELGMYTARFPPFEISRKLRTCLVIDVYILYDSCFFSPEEVIVN